MARNKGDRTAQRRRWKERHPDKLAEQKAGWRDRWRKANPEKKAAHAYVYRALKAGLLKRPDRCAVCLAIGPVEAHHEDYSMPLQVIWVCCSCHRKYFPMFPSALFFPTSFPLPNARGRADAGPRAREGSNQ